MQTQGYYVPTATVIRRRDLDLKSHSKDFRNLGSNSTTSDLQGKKYYHDSDYLSKCMYLYMKTVLLQIMFDEQRLT